MSIFCTACRIHIDNSDQQREHYKSEWHHYNLKRQLCQLPPVAHNIFVSRNEVFERETQELQKKKGSYCNVCHKRFTSLNAYEDHVRSKRHELNEKAHKSKTSDATSPTNESHPASAAKQDVENEEGEEEEEDDETEALGLEECFFCSNIAKSLTENVEHMSKMHSFFIPEAEYLTDLEGFIAHLGEKVGVGHMCLWCNERSKMFYTVDAVRKHMRDKGHCKLMFDGDAALEYADFFDYRSSWEGVESAEEGSGEAPVTEVTENEDFELVLPSGATIGHRSLMRYYRQSLPPERQLQLHRSGQTKLSAVLAQYKAIGWNGRSELSKQRRQDLSYIQKQKARYLKQGMRNNKFQKYFRPQVIF